MYFSNDDIQNSSKPFEQSLKSLKPLDGGNYKNDNIVHYNFRNIIKNYIFQIMVEIG